MSELVSRSDSASPSELASVPAMRSRLPARTGCKTEGRAPQSPQNIRKIEIVDLALSVTIASSQFCQR